MMKENEIAALIEWGKEEKQSDFLGFVNFCIENRASKNLIEVEMDGERKEFPLEVFWFDYKKPFPDFDFTIFYDKYNGMVSLPYTEMKLIKKIDENAYRIETEKGKCAIIRLKEGQ